MTLSGSITQAALRTDFDALTANVSADSLAGDADVSISHLVLALATGTGVANFVDFTAPDDMEARVLRVCATDGTAARTVTAFLEQTDGDTAFLLDQTISKDVTTVVGTAQASLDLRTTTQSKRIKLIRGVRYRLRLSTTAGPVTSAQVTLVCRTRRRRR